MTHVYIIARFLSYFNRDNIRKLTWNTIVRRDLVLFVVYIDISSYEYIHLVRYFFRSYKSRKILSPDNLKKKQRTKFQHRVHKWFTISSKFSGEFQFKCAIFFTQKFAINVKYWIIIIYISWYIGIVQMHSEMLFDRSEFSSKNWPSKFAFGGLNYITDTKSFGLNKISICFTYSKKILLEHDEFIWAFSSFACTILDMGL